LAAAKYQILAVIISWYEVIQIVQWKYSQFSKLQSA
jgi:hypothetical protein